MRNKKMQKVKNLHLYSEENLKARAEAQRFVYKFTLALAGELKAIKEAKDANNEI